MKMSGQFEFFYCCPDDPWLLDSEDQGYPNSIKREWLDAIHKLTSEYAERRVRLPDFGAMLLIWDCKCDLYITGWGFKQQTFEVTPEEVARIHAATSPERLNELERQGRQRCDEMIERYKREQQASEEGLEETATDASGEDEKLRHRLECGGTATFQV